MPTDGFLVDGGEQRASELLRVRSWCWMSCLHDVGHGLALNSA